MILALDVHYVGRNGFCAGVGFAEWVDPEPVYENVTITPDIEGYEPGAFFKRELPCLLTLIHKLEALPDLIIIDGYVFLDGRSKPGLGKRLHDALDGTVPVIGVAKSAFHEIDETFAVYRGRSKQSLYVTSVGIETGDAQAHIRQMAGTDRMPTLLRRTDALARSAGK